MDFQSPKEVLNAIISIFPGFKAEWEEDNPYIVEGEFSIHSVYMTFLPYLATSSPTETQLSKVASLVNGAVSAGHDSENAVSTCFLEHVYRVGLAHALKPLLSNGAKERLHA